MQGQCECIDGYEMVGKMCKFIPSKGKLFDIVQFEEYYAKQKNLKKIIF